MGPLTEISVSRVHVLRVSASLLTAQPCNIEIVSAEVETGAILYVSVRYLNSNSNKFEPQPIYNCDSNKELSEIHN